MASAPTRRVQPQWAPETSKNTAGLVFYNSLSRKKEAFQPKDGNTVNWYICGPTVYDNSHMGHARTYVSFDIIRRVMMNYFNYNVFYIMNVTDIDDKIILKARKKHLFQEYLSAKYPVSKVTADLAAALDAYHAGLVAETDPAKKEMKEKVYAAAQSYQAINGNQTSLSPEEFALGYIKAAEDPLSAYLDKLYGHTVSDNKIFSVTSAYWEADFHECMRALNVLPADTLTRVTEFVPEIVCFIERIIANGYAYESNGSVYFDTDTFSAKPNHFYAKLKPENYGRVDELAEAEGELSTKASQSEKRSPNDFALWKKSKQGEPIWESPWGLGRPGWHIECSCMASYVVDGTLDIHSGGCDLAFPHHDNEIAQSEAYYDADNWVNYFLHTGHLDIEGRKMSKSLKNFITIQEALEKYSARQLRFLFALHNWNATLDYSSDTMTSALQYEKTFTEFGLTMKHVLGSIRHEIKFTQIELALNKKLMNYQAQVHQALCDNINTREVLLALRAIMTDFNIYIKDVKDLSTDNPSISKALISKAATFVFKILNIMGFMDDTSSCSSIGFPIHGSGAGTSGPGNAEAVLLPVAKAVSGFRDDLKAMAIQRDPKDTQLLKLCDSLRDDVLPTVGVRLEDTNGGATMVKLINPQDYLREKQLKEEEMQTRAERLKQERRQQELAKLEKGRLAPTELFKEGPLSFVDSNDPSCTEKAYSEYDERGMPTKLADGSELAKATKKKLEKLYAQQEKIHDYYLANKDKHIA